MKVSRARETRGNSYGTPDIYLHGSKHVNYDQFKEIVSAYYEVLKEALFNGEIIRIPYGLGSLYLEKFKPKAYYADPYLSKINRKHIPQLNQHTRGYIIRLKWFKHWIVIPNKGFYRVQLLRPVKRKLSKELLNGTVNIDAISSA